jgi:hypothetical protein
MAIPLWEVVDAICMISVLAFLFFSYYLSLLFNSIRTKNMTELRFDTSWLTSKNLKQLASFQGLQYPLFDLL